MAPSRWSLRTRLIALLMVLLATVSMAIVFITAVALRGVLLDQLDRRLGEASGRWGRILAGPFDPTPDGGLPPSGSSGSGGSSGQDSGNGTGYGYGAGYGVRTSLQTTTALQNTLYSATAATLLTAFFRGPVEPGTVAAVIDATGTYAAYLDSEESAQQLTTSQSTTVAAVPRDGRFHTDTLGSDEYRLVAITEPNGLTLVTALPMKQINATLTRMAVVSGVVALAGVAFAAVAGTVILRVTLRPLRRVAATASRVVELPLDRGEVALSVRVPEVDTDPRTEVGQVGAALNRMLGHIGGALEARHASEMRMRQFLADVSHELRTPLAAISGYAELTRRTHEPVPADVTYAMSRVESESARMTALVSDLLLLARIDSGRPLEHEPVDISRLVVDAVSDAHVAAPEHRFALDLPEEPVTVTGDSARLHQVVANLLANARTHTPPETRVTASLSLADGEVVIAIVDEGPGISPELLPQVFERFARGDSSRSRAAGSTGLGLAIVSAVVEAHHGRVEAQSRPGRTAFIVRLPQTRPATAVGSEGGPLDLAANPTPRVAPTAGFPPALRAGAPPLTVDRPTRPILPPLAPPPAASSRHI
ncbi:HAMP domain-containing sensor histidine kinase [Frankia sp. AgB32]|uniref:sensor histidine kinase n=1 Tax=Frankia sp. AgB32 TaxID=631119 RepID=UPI00200EDE35|nr:HAMP domain-containing sensor histidine kinase [Frankia sp. AgB32]MCK9895645.1 HAMP domain-containing histidine kinase [Frankia sp. AgB32]